MDPVEVLHPHAGVVVAHAPPVARLVVDGPSAKHAMMFACMSMMSGSVTVTSGWFQPWNICVIRLVMGPSVRVRSDIAPGDTKLNQHPWIRAWVSAAVPDASPDIVHP